MESPPLLRTALQCWKKALSYTSTATPYSKNIPLLGIPTQQGRLTKARIHDWVETGVEDIGAFLGVGNLLDHESFLQTTGAPTRLYLLHATVSHYIRNTCVPQRSEPPQHNLVHLLYGEWETLSQMAV